MKEVGKYWDLEVKMWRTEYLLFRYIPLYEYSLCKDGRVTIHRYSIFFKLKR